MGIFTLILPCSVGSVPVFRAGCEGGGGSGTVTPNACMWEAQIHWNISLEKLASGSFEEVDKVKISFHLSRPLMTSWAPAVVFQFKQSGNEACWLQSWKPKQKQDICDLCPTNELFDRNCLGTVRGCLFPVVSVFMTRAFHTNQQ